MAQRLKCTVILSSFLESLVKNSSDTFTLFLTLDLYLIVWIQYLLVSPSYAKEFYQKNQ